MIRRKHEGSGHEQSARAEGPVGSYGRRRQLMLCECAEKLKEVQRTVRPAAPWKTKKVARRTCRTTLCGEFVCETWFDTALIFFFTVIESSGFHCPL